MCKYRRKTTLLYLARKPYSGWEDHRIKRYSGQR